MNNLYKYTENEEQEVAWLTLPVYGAWSAVYYDNNPQKWIRSNVTSTSNKYAGTTWNSSGNLKGSSVYFTSTTARGMGYNSRTNYTQETVTFYVTNTTAVQLLGLGQTRSSSSYPATLKIYECTQNTDDTLTEGTTAVKSGSNSATSGTFVLSATDLDASKIYKVEAATYRSYICEIGFQTPIQVEKTPTLSATPADIVLSAPAGASVPFEFTVTGKNVTDVITLSMTDNSGAFTLDKQSITVAEAGNGAKVTGSFHPETAGNYAAAISLMSDGAETIVVNLSGEALQPEIMAEPGQLTLETEAGTPVTSTFHVQGSNMADVVSMTLTDEQQVFAISQESLTIAEAEEGMDIGITFSPTATGTFNGTVTISTKNAANAVVELEGVSNKPIPDYYDLTITSVGLSTLYLDYPVEIPYDTYDPDLLGIYYVYQINGNELKKARLNSVIPAYTGVIVHGNTGTYRFPSAKGSTYQLPRDNYLSGSVERILTSEALAQSQYPDGKIYTLGRGGTDNFINFYIYTGTYLNANKAFLVMPGSTEADHFSFDSNEETGIHTINMEEDVQDWYTLQGIKLNGKPSQHGVYIHKGKTITIR